MKTAIVTGANGFLGKAIVQELLEQSVQVISLVHSLHDSSEEIRNSKIIECGLDDYLSVAEKIAVYKPDVFYHLAWAGTSGTLRADERIQLANVQGTCDAVRLAVSSGCSKFIFASSIMEYEVAAEINNMNSPGINSIYSTAKLSADYMGRIIANNLGIQYISALISNVYGPGEKSPRLINSSIRKLLNGEHLSLSPCEQLYDFIFITDAAKMFVAIGEKGVSGRIYYIGNQNVYPLKHFMTILRDEIDPKADLGFGDLPFNGVSLTYNEFNKELLCLDTGVKPMVPFSEGICITKKWIAEVDMNE